MGSTDLRTLIARWAEVAVSHAVTRRIEDPPGLVATVEGVGGAWGLGQTNHEALEDLESVLREWAAMKLRDGDRDIGVSWDRPLGASDGLTGR